MPAVFFFLIDVSMNAIQIGATAAACSAISQVIADLPVSPISFAVNCSNVVFCFAHLHECMSLLFRNRWKEHF